MQKTKTIEKKYVVIKTVDNTLRFLMNTDTTKADECLLIEEHDTFKILDYTHRGQLLGFFRKDEVKAIYYDYRLEVVVDKNDEQDDVKCK